MIALISLFIYIVQAQEFTCVFKQTGDLPKIKFRGNTREEAMERTVRLCLNLRTREYITVRFKKPSDERLIVFLEDCVNNTYCIEKDAP